MAYSSRPVPQNVMNVEFKIFEFMTLKQFLWTFGLVLLAGLLFWLLPPPWKVLVPLLIIIFGGVVIFVPFNGEPFQVFINSYLEAMISPQRRIWNKKGVILKSAYKTAYRYQYGNDPDNDVNKFKFNQSNEIKLSPEQQKLDVEEEKFIHKEVDNSMNTNYKPPVQKQQITNNIISNTNGTSISQKTIRNSVDLNKFPDNKPQSQLQNSNSDQNVPTQSQNIQKEIAVQQSPENTPQSNVNISLPKESQHPTPVKEDVEVMMPVATVLSTESENKTPQNANAESQVPNYLAKENKTPSSLQSNSPQNDLATNSQEVQNTIKEINELTTPKKDQAMEDILPKNFIFGTVEDAENNPVTAAAVILKSGEENLEIVYTNTNGDFQSHYEYKSGTYTLHVNVDSKEFNEVNINHDPIDPVPVIIRPKKTLTIDDIIKKEQENKAITHESEPESAEGVFMGNYDAKSFDLGDDYKDLEIPVMEEEKPQEPVQFVKKEETPSSPVTTNPVDINLNLPTENKVEENNSLDIQTPNQTTNDQENEEIPTISSLNKDLLQNQELDLLQNLSSESPSNEPSPATAEENNQNHISEEVINYLNLSSTKRLIDTNLTNLPNTINGVVLDNDHQPLSGVVVHIFDNSKRLIKNMTTDINGNFYSRTKLENGFYYIDLAAVGHSFAKYYIKLDDTIIPSKEVISIK